LTGRSGKLYDDLTDYRGSAMLIVEGPDGSGKTTLVKVLAETLNWPVAERVVDTETNAMTDLRVWTEHNLQQGFQTTIFDRHRLMSEPILRANANESIWYETGWMEDRFKELYDLEPVVIYCIPPLDVMLRNLEGDPHNKAVLPYADSIYRGYVAQAASARAADMFACLIYDYTQTDKAQVLDWVKEELKP
jgi:energy-coupling factor transporter ATP-binding protein EcfA2